MATVNEMFFVHGGASALYGRVDDTHIAPRIIIDSDDLDNVSLDLTNMELLSNFQIIIQSDNVYLLMPIGIKTNVQKSLSTISTAYVMEVMDKLGIFSTVSEAGNNETEANPITQPTISTIK